MKDRDHQFSPRTLNETDSINVSETVGEISTKASLRQPRYLCTHTAD